MVHFDLSNNLSIKELEPYNPKDIWLAKELDEDKEVQKYLWSIKSELEKMKLDRIVDPYNLSYALYKENEPIGYFELSHLKDFINEYNYISYALLESERKKGYATIALRDTSALLLTNGWIDKVLLCIEIENIRSKNVAIRAGFAQREEPKIDFLHLEKTQLMLKRERCLHRHLFL